MKNFVLFALGLMSITARAQDYSGQYQRSISGVLANIQLSGAVVASPSTSEPNYSYDWVRDTALTMKTMARIAYAPETPSGLKQDLLMKLDRWIHWELHLQETPKLTDLGEPRFNLNGTANFDPWGRPQNDGPALRALTAMEIANHWINEGRLKEVQTLLYNGVLPANTLIKRDLEYVAHHWNETSFDLWEEERGFHFYTLTAQKVAMLKGALLARRLGDSAAADFYNDQANQIQILLNGFYDPSSGTIRYTINKVGGLPHKTSSLDIAVILAAIQTFDGSFYVPVKAVYQTLSSLTSAFNSIYSINQVKQGFSGETLGVALGRYPQDIYSGAGFGEGNPWFLSTLASAEFLCDLSHTNIGFRAKSNLDEISKSQFNRVLHHMLPNGALSEQFNRYNGYEQGARDLTWSYVSYLTAYRACF